MPPSIFAVSAFIRLRSIIIFALIAAAAGISLIPAPLHAYTSPGAPQGFVSDFANVLSDAEEQELEAKLMALDRETGVEAAAVTVGSLDDETIESYAVKLFEEWGIGDKKNDTGLLILVAPNDRVARIEVGYGLEGTVTDLQAGQIVRNIMIPAFREGSYAAGMDSAVDALGAIITGSPEAAQYLAENPKNGASDAGGQSSGSGSNYIGLVFFAVIMLNVLARALGRTKSWWLGGVIGAGLGAIIGLIWGFVFIGLGAMAGLAVLGLLFDYIVSKRPPGSGGRGGRGGSIFPFFFGGGSGGHGGGFGGFGGFGGGMSGGGGASGRW